MFRSLTDGVDASVRIDIDGSLFTVSAGISVAAAVLQTNIISMRTTPVTGSPRAPYCMMGVCFECLMAIDGMPNRPACMIPVADGMRVRRQHGAPAVVIE